MRGISLAFKQSEMWGISLMPGRGRHGCRYRKVGTDGKWRFEVSLL